MQVDLTRRAAKGLGGLVPVKSWAEASETVQEYIARHDLGAGCSDDSDAFIGGEVYDDEGHPIGRISYNGRAWDNDGKEVQL